MNWGGKQGARVCERGASIYERNPKGRRHIGRGSEGCSRPQMLTNFRWPWVACKSSKMLIYHLKSIIVHRDYWKYTGRNQDVFMPFLALKLLIIKLTISGLRTKMCNIHTVKILLKSILNLLFQSNSPYIRSNIRILYGTTYEGPGGRLQCHI